jgi:hypothetical protein
MASLFSCGPLVIFRQDWNLLRSGSESGGLILRIHKHAVKISKRPQPKNNPAEAGFAVRAINSDLCCAIALPELCRRHRAPSNCVVTIERNHDLPVPVVDAEEDALAGKKAQ